MSRKIDWSALAQKLKPETIASINAFRRKHADLAKSVADLKESFVKIDFDFYKKTLQNKQVVTSAQSSLEKYQPIKLDISSQLKSLEQAEKVAVQEAQLTVDHVKAQIDELKVMLKNIESARPIDQLLVDDVAAAYPGLDDTVAKMTKRGQWAVPGYYEKFGSFVVGF